MGEQAGAEPDQRDTDGEQRGALKRGGEYDETECGQPDHGARTGKAVWVRPTAQQPRRRGEPGQSPHGQQRRHRRGGADGQPQDAATIGFQQDVLHGECHRAHAERDEPAPGAGRLG